MHDKLRKVLKKALGLKTIYIIRRILLSFLQIRDVFVARYHYMSLIISRLFKKHTALDGVEFRLKRHVLFVAEKWCDRNPAMGSSNNEHNLFGSLATSGLATQDRFHFDEYCLQYNHTCDAALLRLCMETKPDLLFFSWCGGRYDPKWETLSIIRRKLGIPVVAIWWEVSDIIESVLPHVNLNVVLHSSYLKKTNHPEKYLLMWTPQDSKVYYNPNIKRDIDISFIGSMNRPDRQKGIPMLKDSGINVYQSGGQREYRLSIDEYARFYMRSKIALNFSCGEYWNNYNILSYIHHAKGRIFEATLCGAMLLEAENPETRIWFEPMIDYVPFANEVDLVEKAKYYLEHDLEREKIAANGHRKAKEKYNSEMFWRIVFTRIFGTNFQ